MLTAAEADSERLGARGRRAAAGPRPPSTCRLAARTSRVSTSPGTDTRPRLACRRSWRPRRSQAVRAAQVVVGGAQRLDRVGARLSSIESARPGKGRGGAGPGVPGSEPRAAERLPGGLIGNFSPFQPSDCPSSSTSSSRRTRIRAPRDTLQPHQGPRQLPGSILMQRADPTSYRTSSLVGPVFSTGDQR